MYLKSYFIRLDLIQKAVYSLDVGIEFLLARLEKNPEEEKSKNGMK